MAVVDKKNETCKIIKKKKQMIWEIFGSNVELRVEGSLGAIHKILKILVSQQKMDSFRIQYY